MALRHGRARLTSQRDARLVVGPRPSCDRSAQTRGALAFASSLPARVGWRHIICLALVRLALFMVGVFIRVVHLGFLAASASPCALSGHAQCDLNPCLHLHGTSAFDFSVETEGGEADWE